MILITANKRKQILFLRYIGHVRVEELKQGRKDVEDILEELSPNFRLVGDLSDLETLDKDCAAEIAEVMELCDRKGVGLLVRVVPDPSKDIGFGIMAAFHYSQRPRMVLCENMLAAAKVLEL